MKRFINSLLIALLMTAATVIISTETFAQSVTLAWSPSTNPDIASYGIYRSTNSDSNFVLLNAINHPDTMYIDNTVQWDTQYYYAATSIDQYSNESGFSNSIDTLLHAATPVELSYFACSFIESKVMLNWTTSSEVNNFGFEIQKSINASSGFNKIGFVNGNGTTNDSQDYEYVDEDVTTGIYYYRIKQIDYDGDYKFSNVFEVSVNIPNKFYLAQNYPNPFNSSTSISYTIPTAGNVQVIIYNMNGKEVYKAVDKFHEAGSYSFFWNGLSNTGKNLASGVYYYKIWTNDFSSFKKMTLLK